MDNIKTWTGLSVEESVRMTEDRDKWRKYVHGVANPRIEDWTAKEQEHNMGKFAKLWWMPTRLILSRVVYMHYKHWTDRDVVSNFNCELPADRRCTIA